MSTLHISPDGREMLDLVDKLRNIDGIENTVPLPQIVVVGQQSCGKSSVLHAISGIQFPTDDGLCTQFPTEIILRRESIISTKASIRSPADISEQRKAEYKSFEQMWSNTSLDNLKHIITDAKAVLKLNDRKRFCPESLVLEVSGPDQEHLTLIDLPGFFVSTQVNQSQSDIELVNDIAKHYIDKERAIVLAVVSGKNDFENQKILEDLKSNEHFRRRTLGVITAPDAIERGSRREQECMDLIQKDPRNLGHGWHMLRNLKYSEVLTGVCDRDEIEQQCFEQTEPWNSLDKSRVGSQALKTRLSIILKSSIAQSLPEIQQEVEGKLAQIEVHLEALGQARASPGELREYLCDRAGKFEQEVKVMLSGSPPRSTYCDLADEASLRAFVQSQYVKFANDMFDRGKELPNLLHPDWASTIFERQSQRWVTIAKHHCNIIFNEVEGRIIDAVEGIAEETTAERLLHDVVQPALRTRKAILDAKLEELYRPYTQPGIHCLSRRYRQIIDHQGFSRSASEEDQCLDILRSAEAYYEVACEVFTENVVNLGVENCLLDNLQDVLSPKLFYSMDDERLNLLGGEARETKLRRSKLISEQKQFEEARDQILPSLGNGRIRIPLRMKRPARAARKMVSLPSWSVSVTEATPPVSAKASPIAQKTPSQPSGLYRESSPAPSTSSTSDTSSPEVFVFSGSTTPAHSRSASSVSSTPTTPQSHRKISKHRRMRIKDEGEEEL
ncbi:hypothetical protein PMZ80_010392 [Knufia obscura]|uniref:Uncharacterized protein n=1 Tax=Knufia obscura TaxID=1635080 RepID=A0ABR0RAV0_9EURO|nr:hypothetical protein PMZ80_010392 [Knufia obscura]